MRVLTLVVAVFAAFFLLGITAHAETTTFQKPRHNDVRLDWCYSWKVKDCGQKVANLFCAARHHTAATDFKMENAGGQTRFIGSNESCNDKGCVYRILNPRIDMVESAKNRHGCYRASPLDRPVDRTIFAQRPVGTGVIVVGRVGRQNSAQVRHAKNRDVVEDFALDRAD